MAEGPEAKAAIDEHSAKILKVREIMKERDQARKSSDFAKSDFLRDKLSSEFLVVLFDQNGGPSGWKFKDGSTKKLATGIPLPQSATLKRSREEAEECPPVKVAKQKSVKEAKPSKPLKTSVEAESSRNAALVKSLLTANTGPGRNVNGVIIEDLKIGSGRTAKSGNRVKVHYCGKLKSNNKTFDACLKKPFPFRLGKGEVIKGWDIGCDGMNVGGKRRLTIPPEKAYGNRGAPPTIPPNATLIFEVTMLDVL